MNTEWHATVIADGVPAALPEDLARIHTHIPGATRHDADTGRLTLSWRLHAPTLTQATDDALRIARAALRDVYGRAHLIGATVRTAADHEHAATHPAPQDLVGYKEAGEILGVSRQRIAELERTHPGFPQPIARLAAGPVFSAESVRRFDAGWERKRTGRPRTQPAA